MSWQPPPPQGGSGGAGAGGGGSGWAPPPPQQQQQQQQWSGGAGGGAQAQQRQQHHQQQASTATTTSTFAPPPPASTSHQQGPYGAPNPSQGGGGGWGAPQQQQQQQQYGGYNQQTAAFAQAALGAALGGVGGMDAANLMAGFASAAINGSGNGGGGGRSSSFFEKGASWATSRLGALVGGGGGGRGNEHYPEGSPGFDGAAGGGPHPYHNQRRGGGGLFSFLSPVGGASTLSVSTSYCRTKLLLLSAPWLRRWPYQRVREHHSAAAPNAVGGLPPRYAPPSRDVHAPDLYIPAMALATLALLRGAAEVFSNHHDSAAAFTRGHRSNHHSNQPAHFSPDSISGAVSSLATAWALHGAAIKAALWALGSGAAQAVPLAELMSYAGYPLFHGAAVCAVRGGASLASSRNPAAAIPSPASTSSSPSSTTAETANAILNRLGSGSASGATGAARWAGDAAVLWGGAAAGVFLVRSLKRVLFHDARGGGGNGYGYGGGGNVSSSSSSSSRSNYVLLLLWFAQFPLVAWLARGCRVVS